MFFRIESIEVIFPFLFFLQSIQAAQKDAKYGKKVPYDLQYLYFFIGETKTLNERQRMFSFFYSSCSTLVSTLFSIHYNKTRYYSSSMDGKSCLA
jgi:hypothetical protein